MKNILQNGLFISMLLNVLLVGGCGGGGTDSPGITVSAVILPYYNGGYTSSVDTVPTFCTNGTNTQYEHFADHQATASITASIINPSNVIEPMTAFIDSYTITFNRNADSPGAPSIQSDTREVTFSFIVNDSTEALVAEITVELVDLIRKGQYYSATVGSLNNYTATYVFSGHTENGEQFTVTSKTNFQIGSFNNCPDGFWPI